MFGERGLLPKDAQLAGLWPERVVIQSRECLLPGTSAVFRLVLEGNALRIAATSDACLVVAKDRQGYVFHIQFPLDSLGAPERQLVALFIAKGRGEPLLERSAK